MGFFIFKTNEKDYLIHFILLFIFILQIFLGIITLLSDLNIILHLSSNL